MKGEISLKNTTQTSLSGKLLSWLLVFVMVFSILPTAALAAEPSDEDDTSGDAEATYVLMNIPYADFYAAEGTADVDAVSSATLNKTRTASLAGGSYHVNSDGTDITGITFPVKVDEGVDLSDYEKITEASSVTISVTNRG